MAHAITTQVKDNTATTTGRSFSLRKFWEKQVSAFEKSRFAAMTLLMTGQSCLGSAACLYLTQANAGMFVLGTGVMATMMSNSFFIAQSPSRWCLGGFYASVIINTSIIALYI